MSFTEQLGREVRSQLLSSELLARSSGRVFFVKPADAADSARFNREHPAYEDNVAAVYTTVDAAISACTAAVGDTVYVCAGHTETVTATSVAFDVSGVSVIGLGNGLNRPTFTFGAAAATITVSAANCTWKNCHFIGNFLDVAAAFTIGAAKDFRLENNTFVDNTASLGFLSVVVTGATDNGADGLTVVGNYWRSLDVSPNAFVSILAAEVRLVINDNSVHMDATNDVGHFITLAAKIVSGVQILRNHLIVVGSTGAAVGIFLTGSGTTSTGVLAYNFAASLDATAELIMTASTGLRTLENYYQGVADKNAKLWPVVNA